MRRERPKTVSVILGAVRIHDIAVQRFGDLGACLDLTADEIGRLAHYIVWLHRVSWHLGSAAIHLCY